MLRRRRLRAHALVRHIAGTPFYAVVGGNHAGRAKGLVVIRWQTDSRAQLFIEAAKVGELLRLRREFAAVVGKQELLIAGVPEAGGIPRRSRTSRLGRLPAYSPRRTPR